MTIMKKYMLFDGNFDFDKFCDAVNSMKDEHIIFAHITKDDDDCYICDEPVEGSVKVEFYYCDRLVWQLLDIKVRVERGKAIA